MIFTVGIIFTLLAVAIVSYFITRYVFFEDSFLLSSVYEDFGDCKANQVKSGHLMFCVSVNNSYMAKKMKFAIRLWSFQRRQHATRGRNRLSSRNSTSTHLTPPTVNVSDTNINNSTNNASNAFNNNDDNSRGRTDTAISVSASSASVTSEADNNQNISLFDDIEEILASIRLAAATSPIDSLPPEARREYVSNVLIVKVFKS